MLEKMRKAEIGETTKRIKDVTIYEDIRSAEDLCQAVEVLANERCTLGLVLIVGMREAEREQAVRALAGFASYGEISVSNWAVEQRHKKIFEGEADIIQPHETNANVVFRKMYVFHELVARIALEENSTELAGYVLFIQLQADGIARTKRESRSLWPFKRRTTEGEKTAEVELSRKLIDLLVEHDEWLAIDWETNRRPHGIPEDAIITFGNKIERIARAHARFILPAIAAVHPEKKVREQAIKAIVDGRVDNPGNKRYCLVQSMRNSKFEDTAIEAIDESVKITRERMKRGEQIGDAGLRSLARSKHALPRVAEYALAKMFELWDTHKGYAYLHQWEAFPKPVEKAIQAYFERNFDKLVANKEHAALGFLWLQKSARAEDALRVLGEQIEEIDRSNFKLLNILKENSKDKGIKARAEELIEEHEEAEKKRIAEFDFRLRSLLS
ncbi:hypothetical protein HY992_05905 [Candidatus Micrarchaeota archaeon]|nr:hypothetical protein [Candidatus Micrarchaeota archaeon]